MATEAFKHGLGEAYKRKEDARFIRGQGNYVDDIQLKGMLYGDIVRSPYAHALIKSIDSSAAMQVPGVVAVITGKDLDAAGLAWMPTLSGDTEAVLALDRVHFQMQEVAFVVATSRYAAADGVAAVEVEYEPLQVVVDPKRLWHLMPRFCARTRRTNNPPTRSTIGRQATGLAPMRTSPRQQPMALLSSRICIFRAFTRLLSRRVAVLQITTRRQVN